MSLVWEPCLTLGTWGRYHLQHLSGMLFWVFWSWCVMSLNVLWLFVTASRPYAHMESWHNLLAPVRLSTETSDDWPPDSTSTPYDLERDHNIEIPQPGWEEWIQGNAPLYFYGQFISTFNESDLYLIVTPWCYNILRLQHFGEDDANGCGKFPVKFSNWILSVLLLPTIFWLHLERSVCFCDCKSSKKCWGKLKVSLFMFLLHCTLNWSSHVANLSTMWVCLWPCLVFWRDYLVNEWSAECHKIWAIEDILELRGRKFSPTYIAKIVAYCMCALIFVVLNTTILFWGRINTRLLHIEPSWMFSLCIARWQFWSPDL